MEIVTDGEKRFVNSLSLFLLVFVYLFAYGMVIIRLAPLLI